MLASGWERAVRSGWERAVRSRRLFFTAAALAALFLCCLCALANPTRALAADTLRIVIPSTVTLSAPGENCSLAEIAEIDGPSSIAAQAGALILFVRNGGIDREQVVEALKVSGLGGVRVSLKMPKFTQAQVQLRAAGTEDADGGSDQGNVRESGASSLTELVKSLAAWDWDVEVQTQGPVPPGRLVSPASLVPGSSAATLAFRDDKTGREKTVAVRMTWTQPALILTRAVKKGEAIREADLTPRTIKINKAGVYAWQASDAVGRVPVKNLSQGSPLRLDSLTGAAVVQRGASVSIVMRSGGLTVKAKGEALEDGAIGDTIKVRNATSKHVVEAVVVANDAVEVKT
ncbi:MAG: flagellar basal body P-ring formation chaperone FlgA [Synergistaceae bacterium]|jgi:flagella basal body P-ring formation protein FlgA|nr:flagellar basal body P-ring formation chaperone FlgA [Synergistaceae bacterium]